MRNRVLATVLCVKFLFLAALPALGATYYVSPSGSDFASGASQTAPWKTFSHAFSSMAASDELVLLDGTYSEAAGTGYISYLGIGSAQPPSGLSKAAPTVVRSLNPGKVKITGRLFIGRSTRKDSYIKIQGITFEGGGSLYNTSYVYIKGCGFHSTGLTGGNTFGIGTNDGEWGNTYDLVEDSWVWGQERVIAINYRADYNVWRRVVVRGDGCNSAACTGSGNPNVGISVYDSQNVSIQNVMVVDRVLGGGSPYANFASAQHTAASHWLGPVEWLGSITLNSPDAGFYLEGDYANNNTFTLKDSVSWGSADSSVNISSPGYDMTALIRNVILQNLTVNSSWDNVRLAPIVSTGTVKNINSYSAGRYGINSAVQPSFTNVFGAASASYNQTTCLVGCLNQNAITSTPSALKYLVRVEAGSVLSGTAEAGADYGANVVKRYGADGTFYNDAGFNTLGASNLWPWPNEALIKADMCSSTSRGFCSNGTGIYGGPITLTSYVWETLGNICPSGVCNNLVPSPPRSLIVR